MVKKGNVTKLISFSFLALATDTGACALSVLVV